MRIQAISFITLLIFHCTPALAETIDFEPTSESLHSDNMPFPEGAISGVAYRFGVDSDNDGQIDSAARLEQRGDDSINAYTLGSLADDIDLDEHSDGGDWLLRRPKQTEEGAASNLETALIWELASDAQPILSIGGEIWDVDLGEEFALSLHDQAGHVIETLAIETGSMDARGRATEFQFDDLEATTYLSLTIRLSSAGESAGGYGIDNMQFTVVPEPNASIYWFVITIATLHFARAQEHSCLRKTS